MKYNKLVLFFPLQTGTTFFVCLHSCPDLPPLQLGKLQTFLFIGKEGISWCKQAVLHYKLHCVVLQVLILSVFQGFNLQLSQFSWTIYLLKYSAVIQLKVAVETTNQLVDGLP